MSKVKTSADLKAATKGKSDAGKAGHRPVGEKDYQNKGAIKDAMTAAAHGDPAALDNMTARVLHGDPWDGKRRLNADPKSLRCSFTEEDIAERRAELEKRIGQTPALRDQLHAAADAHKAAKDALAAHLSSNEGYSQITKQGWEYREIETIEVQEKRGAEHVGVRYRVDTGEQVGAYRQLTKDELQESIPGA